jgi:hypothetical protein
MSGGGPEFLSFPFLILGALRSVGVYDDRVGEGGAFAFALLSLALVPPAANIRPALLPFNPQFSPFPA